jgi:hypothetical protein
MDVNVSYPICNCEAIRSQLLRCQISGVKVSRHQISVMKTLSLPPDKLSYCILFVPFLLYSLQFLSCIPPLFCLQNPLSFPPLFSIYCPSSFCAVSFHIFLYNPLHFPSLFSLYCPSIFCPVFSLFFLYSFLYNLPCILPVFSFTYLSDIFPVCISLCLLSCIFMYFLCIYFQYLKCFSWMSGA